MVLETYITSPWMLETSIVPVAGAVSKADPTGFCAFPDIVYDGSCVE